MLSLEEAQSRILESLDPLPTETRPVARSVARHTASEVRSPISLPPFDNSAMDGYAVRALDVAGASTDRRVRLRCLGTVPAGAGTPHTVEPATCVRVFTGSPMPAGADSVVMQEDTSHDPNEPESVWIGCEVRPWENVRFRGEDLRIGTVLAAPGDALTPQRLGLLAAAGISEVETHRPPRVALLATGDELREPGSALGPGQIYESNRLMLAAWISTGLGTPVVFPIIPDRLEATRDALIEAAETCDAVVTTGGASVGAHDHVKRALADAGGSLEFWRVSMKPGKPFVFGRLRGRPLFGLPGNPVSAAATFWVLVRPALLRMAGARECLPIRLIGTLAERISNRGDRRHLVRVRLDAAGRVTSAGAQASHLMTSLADANALLDLPPGADLHPEAMVSVLPLTVSG